MAAKRGDPSSFPSAFLEEDMFEEPYTMDEIQSDPVKYILWAAEHNKIEVVEKLLNSDKSLVNSTDEDQYTPLHRASYNGHLNVMKLLVANGAEVCARTKDGWQPLHSACRWDNVSAAELLITLGADVHCLTNGNNTALHLAAVNGEAKAMLTFLLTKTAIDRSIVNAGGDTAEDIAARNSPFASLFRTTLSHSAEKPDCLHSSPAVDVEGMFDTIRNWNFVLVKVFSVMKKTDFGTDHADAYY